MKKPIFITSDG